MLRRFGEKYGIVYPLLSDEGSHVIRALGLLNESAPERHFGVPYPGTFVLDSDGIVVNRHFYANYRERESGVGVLQHLLSLETSHASLTREASIDDGVVVRAWFDKDSYVFGQRIWATIELAIPDGLHIYAPPVPDGYYPLEIAFEPVDRIRFGPCQFPTAAPWAIDELDESFHTYEGRVRVRAPVTFMTFDAGVLDIALNVSYQSCSSTECGVPQAVRLMLSIPERQLLERPSADQVAAARARDQPR